MGFLSGLFGIGNKDSTTNTSTTSNYNDNRSVQDAGGGVIGSGSVDNSQSTTFVTKDSGNTSSTFLTRDSGNVTNTDSGNTTLNVLDGSAIGRAFDSTDKTVATAFKFGTSALGFGSEALEFGGDSVTSALGFAERAQLASQSAISSAFERALKSSADSTDKALKSSADSTRATVDSLSTTMSGLQRAYSDAKGRGSMTDYITMAAIVGALFVAFMATRK